MPTGIPVSSSLSESINNKINTYKKQIDCEGRINEVLKYYESFEDNYNITLDSKIKIPYCNQISTILTELPEVKALKEQKKISYPKPIFTTPEEPYPFRSSLVQVLEAIKTQEPIEGINLLESIKNSSFSFTTNDSPELSSLVSEILSIAIKFGDTFKPEIQDLGRQAVKDNADDFAKELFPVVQKIKREHHVESFRETIDLLNMKKINTARGGKWHMSTYQNLVKRWKKLGYNS